MADVPIERLASGHLAVAVHVRGAGPLRFLLDTGASVSVVTPATRARLGAAARAGPRAHAKTAAGSAGRVELVDLPPVRLGGHATEGLVAAVMPLDHLAEPLGGEPAGVLGQNFFASYVVEFDLGAAHLRLYDPARAPAWDGAVPLAPLRGTGLFAVEARLEPGDVPLSAVIDLGAGRSVVNLAAARAMGLDVQALREAEAIRGASRGDVSAKTHRFARLSVGGITVEGPRLLVADLPVFRPLGLARRPAMILGFDQLDGRVVGLDVGRRRLFLGPAPTGEGTGAANAAE